MRLIADTHVHIYPFYRIEFAVNQLRLNLTRLDDKAICLAFLAERFDCNFFRDFKKEAATQIRAEVAYLANSLCLREVGFPDLYIFPGRQIVTRERIEVLSLFSDARIGDGLPIHDVIEQIAKLQGVAVISWAPGKWFFKRKKIVAGLLDDFNPGTLLVGDTTLRPTCWPMPLLMKKALRKGFGLLCGSDPLPFSGEEPILGQYGTSLECDFDVNHPVESVRAALTRPGTDFFPMGSRGGLLDTLNRLTKNHQEKKAPSHGPR